jgi:hypothetical protein
LRGEKVHQKIRDKSVLRESKPSVFLFLKRHWVHQNPNIIKTKIEKLILKFIWKHNRSQIAKVI